MFKRLHFGDFCLRVSSELNRGHSFSYRSIIVEIRIENVLSDENLALARESLQGKRDSCGLDGIKISMFDDYWKVNGDKIKQEIYVGKYVPGVVKLHEIVNVKQKRRNISLMNTVDRLIYRALM